jgi:hypothetical protein
MSAAFATKEALMRKFEMNRLICLGQAKSLTLGAPIVGEPEEESLFYQE